MVLRLTKPLNYILYSPSKAQVANQNALECIPLVMEPSSKYFFYLRNFPVSSHKAIDSIQVR